VGEIKHIKISKVSNFFIEHKLDKSKISSSAGIKNNRSQWENVMYCRTRTNFKKFQKYIYAYSFFESTKTCKVHGILQITHYGPW
jgi:hypothetical protein